MVRFFAAACCAKRIATSNLPGVSSIALGEVGMVTMITGAVVWFSDSIVSHDSPIFIHYVSQPKAIRGVNFDSI